MVRCLGVVSESLAVCGICRNLWKCGCREMRLHREDGVRVIHGHFGWSVTGWLSWPVRAKQVNTNSSSNGELGSQFV